MGRIGRKWEMGRWNPAIRAVFESTLILYLYFCVTTVFLVVPPLALKSMGVSLGLRPGTAITLGGVLIAELIALWGASAYYKRKGITIGSLGWSIPTNKATVIVLSLGVAILYSWYTAQIPEVKENIAEISFLKLWGLLVAIPAALIEEVIFRGYVMARLQQVKIAPMFQVLLTSVAFSLLHLGFGLMGVVCTFIVGIALGGLYIMGKRSLLGPVLCHGVINAAIEPWLLLWLLKFYSERFAF
jgi:membrane protease YdiL (CAAX protease family)